MKTPKCWLGALCLALLAGLTLAQEEGKPARKAGEGKPARKAGEGKPARVRAERPKQAREKDALRGEWAMMVTQCNLTEQQQTDLRAKIEARNAAIAEWKNSDNGQLLAKLRNDMAAAKKAGEMETVKTLAQQTKPLQAELGQVEQDTMAAILAILTPEQRANWQGFTLYREVMRRFKKLGLTEEQQTQVRDLCNQSGREIAQLPAEDVKGARQITGKLTKTITDQVLTDEQREQVAQPHRGRKEKKTETAPAPSK